MNQRAISVVDLEYILTGTSDIWDQIKGKNIFITGGTGFFGKWLLESFIYINKKLALNSSIYVLSRDPEVFLKNHPQFKCSGVHLIKGDIVDFEFPAFDIDYIIHGAAQASASLNIEQPVLMFETIVNGTKRVLDLAKNKKVKAILHTSSGAVYGEQPYTITHIAEDHHLCPDIFLPNAAYGEAKRVAEMLSSFYFQQHGVPSKIARCFAFVGPYLPLDGSFAIGNFIKNFMDSEPITVNGDGTAYRSYLYAADLTIWLWVILLKGVACTPYNVGSDESITIIELAKVISNLKKPRSKIIIKQQPVKNKLPLRYVPDVSRAKKNLNLSIGVNLEDAIKRTINFYKTDNEH